MYYFFSLHHYLQIESHFTPCNIFLYLLKHWETSYVWNTDDHFARVSILFGFRPCQIFCLPLEIFLGWCSDEMTLMMGIRNEMQLSFYPDTLHAWKWKCFEQTFWTKTRFLNNENIFPLWSIFFAFYVYFILVQLLYSEFEFPLKVIFYFS